MPGRLSRQRPSSMKHACRWYRGLSLSEATITKRLPTLAPGLRRDLALRALGRVRQEKQTIQRWLGILYTSGASSKTVQTQIAMVERVISVVDIATNKIASKSLTGRTRRARSRILKEMRAICTCALDQAAADIRRSGLRPRLQQEVEKVLSPIIKQIEAQLSAIREANVADHGTGGKTIWEE
jgi:hypothetical protein